MDLIADLLIVNDYNRYVVVNNEALREIYNLFGCTAYKLSISINYGTTCILGQQYSYNL